MKTNIIFEWLQIHSLARHMLLLLIVAIIAWILGQLAAPALMKAIFL